MSADPIAHLLDVCRRIEECSHSSYEVDYTLPGLIDEMRGAMAAVEGAQRAAPAAIVEAVLADITDRRGFRQAWDVVDADIREQIRKDLEVAVMDALRGVVDP